MNTEYKQPVSFDLTVTDSDMAYILKMAIPEALASWCRGVKPFCYPAFDGEPYQHFITHGSLVFVNSINANLILTPQKLIDGIAVYLKTSPLYIVSQRIPLDHIDKDNAFAILNHALYKNGKYE